MGCCISRHSLQKEDNIISSNERKLNLTHCSPSSIELTIKKWVGSEGLTIARLQRAAETLQINIGDFSSPEDPLVLLFSQFKQGNSFNTTELISFCVFLTNARPDEKAKVWFELIDNSLQNQLTYGQIKEFLSMIYKFTFKVLPILAKEDAENGLSAEERENYVSEALKFQKDFVDVYAMKLCPEHTLDKEKFMQGLGIYSKLTYSDGFRQLMREMMKNNKN
jgi:hypothetical protein